MIDPDRAHHGTVPERYYYDMVPEGGNDASRANMQGYAESNFWRKLTMEINQLTGDKLLNLNIPPARVKRMMKFDDEVKKMMLSAEAPLILCKGSEIFIGELALRCWFHTKYNKRKTLQKNDIFNAICGTGMYDFLIDIISNETTGNAQ